MADGEGKVTREEVDAATLKAAKACAEAAENATHDGDQAAAFAAAVKSLLEAYRT